MLNSSLDNNFKIIRTKTPSVANTNTFVYQDTTLYNNYLIESVCFITDDVYMWGYSSHILQYFISTDGIYMSVNEYAKDKDCIITLRKLK